MLHQIEAKILSVLDGRMSAQEIAKKASLPLSSVLSFSQSLSQKGLAAIEFAEEQSVSLSPEGRRYLSEGLPEQRVFAAALKGAAASSLSPEERQVGLAWATKNGWVKVEGGRLVAKASPPNNYPTLLALHSAAAGEGLSSATLDLLAKRKLAQKTVTKTLYLRPVKGKPGASLQQPQVNSLTRDMLLSGSAAGAVFRPYDLSVPVEVPSMATRHPIARLRSRIASIFSQMGFAEMQGGELQSSFWNFDALFQPQDHSARDLADTFYLKGESPLPPDRELVARVKKAHEGKWGGEWSEKAARKTVLRTHTTALSARYLYEKCQEKEPKKFFAIGKVFRNEATDFKHLAEFYQVEGIVCHEGATFRDLLGCLKEFYRKLGFAKIRFEPSYFPYTEPSLQVTVYFEKKKQWLELGGAGIFRPEVSIPLCGRYPVLAWGLSLERPLMLLSDMGDIRDFYKSSVGWIRKQRLD